MPERYLKMRDKFRKEGMSTDKAKEKAAKIFNATRKPGESPLTRAYKEKK